MSPRQVSKAVFAAYDDAHARIVPAPTERSEPEAEPVAEPLELEPRIPFAKPATPPASTAGADPDPGAEDVRRRMLACGASSEFAEQVTGYVHRKGLRGAFAIDGAAAVLGKLFTRAASPRKGTGPARIAFFGPTGAGKTATIAKLGRRLAEAGRSVAFASLDPLGFVNLERVACLEGDRDRTELPLAPVNDASELEELLARHPDLDVVLVDTPGVSPTDEVGLDVLSTQLGALADGDPVEGYLVLSASLERSAVELAASAFSALGPTAVVVTKLDETRAPGAALEAAQRRRLPVAFLCDGQDVRGHLTRPRPADFADLFLRGRLGT